MANQWFRLYAEFATDPKVQMLSEVMQRRLVMLFCMRCNENKSSSDEEISFVLRISNDEWISTKAVFLQKGFITEDNEIINWDRRQFVAGGHETVPVSKSSNYVYFVADSSQSVENSDYYVVKIGISKNPWARAGELQTGNEKKIKVVAHFRADIISDREIHEILAAYRGNGEWFKLPSLLMSAIFRHNEEAGSNYESLRSLIVEKIRSKTTVATKTTTDTDTDTDTDTEQIQNKSIGASASDTPTTGDSETSSKSGNSKPDYPQWFENLWGIYPKRSGGNDKRKAFHAANARVKSGKSHRDLVDAVLRYDKFVRANGNWGTQYVMQAATFFGPGGHIDNLWSFGNATNQQRGFTGSGAAKMPHADVVRGQAQRAFERLNGENGSGVVHENGGTVSQ